MDNKKNDIKEFVRFLKENESYFKFFNNFESDDAFYYRQFNKFNVRKDLFFSENDASDYFTKAFLWHKTNEGFGFWFCLARKWQEKLNKKEYDK